MVKKKEVIFIFLVFTMMIQSVSAISNVQHSVNGNKVVLTYQGNPPFWINIRRDTSIGQAGGYLLAKTYSDSFSYDMSFATNPSKNFYYGVKDSSWSQTLFFTLNTENIKSKFFRNDLTVQSILNGNNHVLSDQNFYTNDDKYNPLSFEFKLINALKQLGFAQLTYSDIPGSTDATAAFYKWQIQNGFDASDVITKKKILLIDEQLYKREVADYEIAKKYLPYEKFADAPVNEPSKEHLAMIYYSLFNSLPETIKAKLSVQIKPNDDYPTVLNLEQFSAFINRYGDPYFGTLLDNQTNALLSSQQIEEMISKNNYHFTFCGEGYYSRRNIGSCSVTDSNPLKNSIGSDIAEASALAHEFGHGVGFHDMIIQEVNEETHDHFGEISYKYDEDYYPVLIRPENNDGEFVSEYAKTNYAEDFAESFSAYLHSAKTFRERAKSNIYLRMKYDFLKDYIFGGREYDTGSLSSYILWKSKNKGLPPHQDGDMQDDPNWVWDYQYPIKATP